MTFPLQSKVVIREAEPLKKHCTFHIGGPASLLAEPHTEDELRAVLDFAHAYNLRFYILGKGSNVLFSDAGFAGLVISMVAYNTNTMYAHDNTIICSAGISLGTLVQFARAHALGGLEFLTGIPGTVGGAVHQNASFRGKAIADTLQSVVVLDPETQTVEAIARNELAFEYRACTNLPGIVLEAELAVSPRNPREIEEECAEHTDYRCRTHDMSHPSAGCIFKNPPGFPAAGVLIDQCGLKGYTVGGAQVSTQHANYILNVENASASDVLAIIDTVRNSVAQHFHINLDLEVEYVE